MSPCILRRFIPRASSSVALTLLAPALALSTSLRAADGTWTSLSSGAWSTSGNWSGTNIADGSGSLADFSTLNITAATTVTLDSNRTIGSLKFADTTGTSAWTIGGTSILTLATGSGSPTITTNTDATINAALQGTQGFVKDGSGTLSLGGGVSNTISGAISVNAGALSIGNANSIKNTTASITVASGATLGYWAAYTGGATMTNALTLGGTGTSNQGAFTFGGNANYNGAITLSSNTKIALGFDGGNLSGTISGTGANLELAATVNGSNLIVNSKIQTGAGGLTARSTSGSYVRLTGANTYTGATSVETGSLIVDGSITSAVTVKNGAVFGGSGSSTQSVQVQSGGSFAAGTANSIGTFTTTGSVIFDSGSTYALQFNSGTAAFDKIVGSDFSLGNSTLTLANTGSGTLGLGQVFTIMDGTGSSISGTFSGLAEGAFITSGTNTFQISYLADSGRDVTLTTVSSIPEPSTLVAFAAAAALGAATLRRRPRDM